MSEAVRLVYAWPPYWAELLIAFVGLACLFEGAFLLLRKRGGSE